MFYGLLVFIGFVLGGITLFVLVVGAFMQAGKEISRGYPTRRR